MPRTWFVCLTIVAAFSSPLFAATTAVTVMAPVSEPVLAVARTIGLDPARDRVRFLPDLVRLTHSGPDDRTTALDPLRRADPRAIGAAARPLSDQRVLVPLDADTWSRTIFRRTVTSDQLLTAIVLDHRAALLASGLLQLDDDSLAWLTASPVLLAELYERAAPQFAAFAASLHIRGGRLVAPGDRTDQALWEAVIGAPLDAPERVVRLLLEPPGNGRLAYFYAMAAGLDPPRQRFLFGPASLDPAARVERFRAIAAAATTLYSEWRVDQYPFARPLHDLALLLVRLQVERDGTPRPPADVAFWSEVWGVTGEGPGATAGTGRAAGAAGAGGAGEPGGAGTAATAGIVDAAWLATHTGGGNVFDRADRLEQIAFAQRVFAGEVSGARADAVAAVRAFPRQKMLLLTLERMGFRAPALYAQVSRQAAQLEIGDATRGFWIMAQVQPALAMLARLRMNGLLDARRSDALVRSLFAVPLDSQHYNGGIARWLARELLPLLPDSTDADTSLLLGLAGPPAGAQASRLEWEGERYRIDFHASEFRRMQAVRDRQGGPTVEFALAIERLAATLASAGLDDDTVAAAHRTLQETLAVHALELPSASAAPEVAAPGVSSPRRLREVFDRINSELAQEARSHEARRAARHAGPLRELVDTLLGEALLSTAYAMDIADPDSPVLLSRNGALRHDFGFGRLDGDVRGRVVWAVPRQDFQPGVAWHVIGSALGLDIGLARANLVRINSDRLAGAPKVSSIDRDGFAVGVAFLDRRRLRDQDRDAIGASIARGRARVLAAAATPAALVALAERLQWEPLRQRALQAVAASPAQAVDAFTLAELLVLGDGPDLESLAAWGVNAMPLNGCPCTTLLTPASWRLLQGRQQLALAAAAVPDLNLRIAAVMAELRVPAVLARPVMAAAVQDFLEEAAPTDVADWLGLAAAARTVTRERVEDYVAAVASVGGALVPDGDDGDQVDGGSGGTDNRNGDRRQ